MADKGSWVRTSTELDLSNWEVNEENDRKFRLVLQYLNSNEVLQTLHLDGNKYFGSVDSCQMLGELVECSTTLTALSMRAVGVTGDGLEYIITGLLRNSNPALVRLDIGSYLPLGVKGTAVLERLVFGNIPTLQDLRLWGPGFTPEQTASLAKALAANTSLKHLAVGVEKDSTHPDKGRSLSSLLRSLTPVDEVTLEQRPYQEGNSKKGLQNLMINYGRRSYQEGNYARTLQSLTINYEFEKGMAENLLHMLHHNSSLQFLGLRYVEFNGEQWAKVWQALKDKKQLKAIDLYCCGNDLGDAFHGLMKLLQTNKAVRHIDLRGTPLEATGKFLQVETILDRNANGREKAYERIIRNRRTLDLSNWEVNETNEKIFRLVLENLKFNQVLRELDLSYNTYAGSVESCKLLGEFLGVSTTLTKLYMNGVGMHGNGLEYIIKGLVSNSESVLSRLEIGSNYNVGDQGALALEALLSDNNPTFQALNMSGLGFTPQQMAPVARALAKNTTLRQLAVGEHADFVSMYEEGPLCSIFRALTPVSQLDEEQRLDQGGRYNESVHDLSISYEYEKGVVDDLVQMLSHNHSLRKLGLRFFELHPEEWGQVWTALQDKHVKDLHLYCCGQGLDDGFDFLLEFLQKNKAIRSIELKKTALEATGKSLQVDQILRRKAARKQYLDILENNLRFVPPKIGRLFLCGYPGAGKKTLRQTMGSQSEGPGNSSSDLSLEGRNQKRNFRDVISDARARMTGQRKRTPGVEIKVLKSSGEKRNSGSDLAGEDEYHALHSSHYMFPDINQACEFLFLYRPTFNDAHDLGDDSIERLERELKHWLSFINSNRKAGRVVPQVSVVLTHLDKLPLRFGKDEQTRMRRYVRWASTTVDKLRQDFTGRVDVHTTVHAVDASSGQHVSEVVKHIIQCFDDMFSLLPPVPTACEKMDLFLKDWSQRHSSSPVISQDYFFRLCRETVRELDALFKSSAGQTNEMEITEVFRRENELAIASYLHDVGSIIHFSRANSIVVDPNWLGNVFPGQLFRAGDETQAQFITQTTNGNVPYEDLSRALESFIFTKKYDGITAENLMQLMKELELCYEDTSESASTSYVIPSTLSDKDNLARQGRRRLVWKTQRADAHPSYSGLRLQCADKSRTSLSQGFFQRFQVHLQLFLRNPPDHVKLESPVRYEVEKNMIRLRHDGLEMLVEKAGDIDNLQSYGGYVDILVKSFTTDVHSDHKLYKCVVYELKQFCASGRGCPGVALEEAVLRPASVQKPFLCCNRRTQAVVKENLKRRLLTNLEEKLEIWGDDADASTIPKGSVIYRHLFPALPAEEDESPVPGEDDVDGEWIDAMELLTVAEVSEAISTHLETVKGKTKDILDAPGEIMKATAADMIVPISGDLGSSSHTSSEGISSGSQDISSETDNHWAQEDGRLDQGNRTTHLETIKGKKKDIFEAPSQRITANGDGVHPTDYHRRDDGRKVEIRRPNGDSIERRINGRSTDSLKRELAPDLQYTKINGFQEEGTIEPDRKLDKVNNSISTIQALQQRLQTTLIGKVDEVMQFSAELQDMPRMAYLTEPGVDSQQKFLAAIIKGRPQTLHFMCESPSQIHYVRDQQGLPLLSDLEGRMNLRRSYEVIMPVILGSLKVLFILVKGQMQDAAGIAKAIPDFSTVAGAAPLTVEALTGETVMDSIRLLSSDAAASDLPNAGVAYAEGSIRTLLGPKLKARTIQGAFGLHPVHYKSESLPKRCFWVCTACRDQAKAAHLLQS